MMSISIFKILQIFGVVSSWSTKALADGKVSLLEAVELAVGLADLLDVCTDIDINQMLIQDTDDNSTMRNTEVDQAGLSTAHLAKPVED